MLTSIFSLPVCALVLFLCPILHKNSLQDVDLGDLWLWNTWFLPSPCAGVSGASLQTTAGLLYQSSGKFERTLCSVKGSLRLCCFDKCRSAFASHYACSQGRSVWDSTAGLYGCQHEAGISMDVLTKQKQGQPQRGLQWRGANLWIHLNCYNHVLP